MDRLQNFLDRAASAPPERDGRYFRTWQRVSVQVQREVRSLAAQNSYLNDIDKAFTMAVYTSCQPSYGRRPMEFTYDLGDPATMAAALRLIGRGLQARLARISAGIEDARLKRRFAPVWHLDILNSVKRKPWLLIKMLAREATMVNALIELGTTRNGRATRRFMKSARDAARAIGVDSEALLDLVLRTGFENLGDGRIFEDDDAIASGSPEARIGGDEDGDDGSANGRGQMADAGIVPDVHLCS